MELKYKIVDVERIIDAHATLLESDNADDIAEKIAQSVSILDEYPDEVVKECMKCVRDLESKNIPITKENFKAIEGYIMIRINFVEKGE